MASATDDRLSLSEHLVTLLHRPVEADTRGRAALHVLDWLACAIGGRSAPAGEIIAGHAETAEGGPAHALGTGRRSLEAALLLNGAVGGLLEMDDIHRSLNIHPGSIIIPAALATAEATGASPAIFLDGVARGYDAAIVTAELLAAAPPAWNRSAIAGRLGAAAAAAFVIGIEDGAAVAALGIAGNVATLQAAETMPTQYLQDAEAAVGGVRAALLAARGMRGPRRIFETLVPALTAKAAPDCFPERDDSWRMAEVSFRPWGVCRHAHAAIDAALELRPKVDPQMIERIRVRTHAQALQSCDLAQPHSVSEAKFSLQHAVAVALAKGLPSLADFDLAGCSDAAIAALREKVELSEDPDYTGRVPAHFGAAMEIEQSDGQRFSIELHDARGDPERPLTIDGLVAKARELMAWSGLLDDRGADRLIEAALYLSDAPSLSSFSKALP